MAKLKESCEDQAKIQFEKMEKEKNMLKEEEKKGRRKRKNGRRRRNCWDTCCSIL
jgi:hypothetical protein